jgi:hypothetical protein
MLGRHELKRISDKGKIPEFFNNKRYDEYYKICGVVKLAHEIQERQNISLKSTTYLRMITLLLLQTMTLRIKNRQ